MKVNITLGPVCPIPLRLSQRNLSLGYYQIHQTGLQQLVGCVFQSCGFQTLQEMLDHLNRTFMKNLYYGKKHFI